MAPLRNQAFRVVWVAVRIRGETSFALDVRYRHQDSVLLSLHDSSPEVPIPSPRRHDLDLLVVVDGKLIGFEFKVSDAPKLTRSMSIACQDLGLHRLVVVSPASVRYPLADRIDVMPLPEAIAEVCSGRID